jgi:ACS family hexuronate transporter-like MFS transporter
VIQFSSESPHSCRKFTRRRSAAFRLLKRAIGFGIDAGNLRTFCSLKAALLRLRLRLLLRTVRMLFVGGYLLVPTRTRLYMKPHSMEKPAGSELSEIPVQRSAVIGKYRWVICALLFLATTINYVDRQILALIKEVLDRQIGWTNEQFGWVNSAFQVAYGLGLLGFGWFVDRYGTKIGYALSIAAWSLAAAAHAIVGSVTGFLAARLALGLGEGGNFPSAIKTVALWFPKSERAFATSVFNSGTNAGALIAPAFVPWLAFKYGWQSPFLVASAAGILWFCFWLPLYNSPAKCRQVGPAELEYIRDEPELGPAPTPPWASLLRYRQTWSFILAKFLTDPVWWFFLIWLPDFFKKTRGLDIKHSWIHIVTIYGIVTIFGVFGGWITGFLTGRGWTVTRARKTAMLVAGLCVLPVLAVTSVGDWTAVLLIGLAASAHQAWSANLFTTVSDMFPKPAIASVVGIGGMAGSAGGFVFPILTGRLIDHFQALGSVTTAYAILFGICGCMYLVAFGLNHLCAPRFEPMRLS